ncbi:MAG: S49 family peptidase [Chloroflexota bacterium]
MKLWETIGGAIFLILCLCIGLWFGQQSAPQPVVGVVRVEGPIDFFMADTLIKLLESAEQDDAVAGVVLEILSPGGLATSSESIFHSILKLREEKPVIAVIDGFAASGGFYIAAAANRIYAPASSYVGNIGTRGQRPSDPQLSPQELSSGPYKISGGSRFDRVRQLDIVKSAFVGNVVHQRENAAFNPLMVDAETIAEARIYLGSEAAALGLIDAAGSRTDGIEAVATLAGVENYRVVNLVEYFDSTPQLYTMLNSNQSTQAHLDMDAAIRNMVETAPPDAVFLLDSRIPLPSLMDDSALDRHLLKLRGWESK